MFAGAHESSPSDRSTLPWTMKRKKPPQAKTRKSVGARSPGQAPLRKVHLTVVRTSAGQPQVRWQSEVFATLWQNDLALATANTAIEMLRDQPSQVGFLALGSKLLAAFSALSSGLLEKGTAGPIGCSEGCDSCCHQVVGVTPVELLVIVQHLMIAGRSIEELKIKARDLAARARGLTPRERYSREHPCVFLEQGRCSIYEARPLACRGVNAMERGPCEELVKSPERREAFLEGGEGSPGYVELIQAVHAMSAGLQLSLAELYALDMHPLDLTLAVDHLLSTDPSALKSWARGESPFTRVRGGYDSHNAARLQAVGVLT
jgi:Fe-S-cluster containining protein